MLGKVLITVVGVVALAGAAEAADTNFGGKVTYCADGAFYGNTDWYPNCYLLQGTGADGTGGASGGAAASSGGSSGGSGGTGGSGHSGGSGGTGGSGHSGGSGGTGGSGGHGHGGDK